MTRTLVFVGPTLAGETLPAGMERLPPAAAGHMLAAAPATPATLILIDGLFGIHRSPWHKEILQLLAAGHRVIGAASMGAIRHAELWPWGMEGAGVIARAYRRGVLLDDGDVAVAHAPAELGWRPLSVALVDVRATLAAARRAGILHAAEAHALATAAAETYFADRSWADLCDGRGTAGARLLGALPRIERRLKRADAHAAFRLAARPRSPALPPLPIAPPPDTGVLALIEPRHPNGSSTPDPTGEQVAKGPGA